MVQLIDKSAVVAEIERRIAETKEYVLRKEHDKRFEAIPEQLSYVLSFLDTLEVKEVDLEKEIDKEMKKLRRAPYYDELANFAKHFFELGVKVQANNVWHSYAEPIDTNRTILILSPNGNSSLALWDGKSLSTTSVDGGHNILCNGDKWTYVEDLVQKGE